MLRCLNCILRLNLFILYNIDSANLKDKYPNFEVGLKCIIMVF